MKDGKIGKMKLSSIEVWSGDELIDRHQRSLEIISPEFHGFRRRYIQQPLAGSWVDAEVHGGREEDNGLAKKTYR
jgi:hypothetical protein